MKQAEPFAAKSFYDEGFVCEIKCTGPADLNARLEEAGTREELRAVVINMTAGLEAAKRNEGLERVVSDFALPLVLAVGGNVTGWAAGVLLLSDICYADASAQIGFDKNEDISHFIGTANQKDSDSRVYSAESAVALGIVNRIEDDNSALQAAWKTAKRISRMAPLAMRAYLAAVDAKGGSLEVRLENEARLFSALFDSKDLEEGIQSFLNKSRPHFRGN